MKIMIPELREKLFSTDQIKFVKIDIKVDMNMFLI